MKGLTAHGYVRPFYFCENLFFCQKFIVHIAMHPESLSFGGFFYHSNDCPIFVSNNFSLAKKDKKFIIKTIGWYSVEFGGDRILDLSPHNSNIASKPPIRAH